MLDVLIYYSKAVMMDEELGELKRCIRGGLRRIAAQIGAGDESALAIWIIEGELACSQRPLRYHSLFGGSGRRLPPDARDAVVGWVERMKDEYGIQSVISLMHAKELAHYADLNLDSRGLLGFYESMGWIVRHLPWPDPAHARSDEERMALREQEMEIRVDALTAFNELPKPVLLHCSAGIDRSAPVAAFIAYHRGSDRSMDHGLKTEVVDMIRSNEA